DRPSDQLVHTVHRVTEGNPLFIKEFLDHLQRHGELRELHGSVVTTLESSDMAIPPSMTAVIGDRIRQISPACHDVLVLGAFLRPGFEPSSLASLAGQPTDNLVGLLEEAVESGVLQEDSHTYRFIHPLVRQALYQEPDATRRQQIHLRIVEHLERAESDSS